MAHRAVLDAYRTALVVPVAMVLLGAAVPAFGLRSARPAGQRKGAAPATRYEVNDGVPG